MLERIADPWVARTPHGEGAGRAPAPISEASGLAQARADARSGDDLVDTLQRWEDFGAVWRVLDRGAAQVTIGLFRCDAGEEVGRLVSGAPELLSFVSESRPHER